ncbi:MAG: ribose-phosphate diphosphokinase [Chlamydiota bacterium]
MNLLFSFSFYEEMAREILKSPFFSRGDFDCSRFSNQELHLMLKTPVLGQTCIILGSISPPEINLFSSMILAHTLKKEGAKKCVALIPYLAYTRHEHEEAAKSQVTALVGKLLLSSGVDQIITIDIHSKAAAELFPLPIHSLFPAKIFSDELKRISFIPDAIISPDEGALERSKEVAKVLDSLIPVLAMYKKRENNGLVHLDFMGPIGKKVLIIDDILDTGETLISAVRVLKALGAQEIVVMVSHGLFTGDFWKQLFELNVQRIYCTNTTCPPREKTEKYPIYFLSVTSILQEFLCSHQ